MLLVQREGERTPGRLDELAEHRELASYVLELVEVRERLEDAGALGGHGLENSLELFAVSADGGNGLAPTALLLQRP